MRSERPFSVFTHRAVSSSSHAWGWTVSAAYAVKVEDQLNAVAGDDAARAQWFDLVGDDRGGLMPALPEGGRLAFDHAQIIADAVKSAIG